MGISSIFRCGAALLLLASCGGPGPLAQRSVVSVEEAPVAEVSRVALLLPLSSPDPATRRVARAMLDAAELAMFDAALPRLILLPRDTHAEGGAGEAAGDALTAGAHVILGPLLSGSVETAASVARRRGVPVIAFSNDSAVAGGGVYLLSYPPEQDIAVVSRYALTRGLRRFAVLAPQTDYGSRASAAFERQIERGGGVVTDEAFYPRVRDGAFEPVRRLAHHDARRAVADAVAESLNAGGEGAVVALEPPPYEAILLPEGGDMLRAVAPLLPYFDIDPRVVRLLGTSLWDDPGLSRSPALQGGWFPAPPPDARAAFVRRFERVYGYAPPRLASLAYDGVSLAATLAARGLAFTTDNLTRLDGFGGVDGIFRFGRDGLAERGLAVMEITPGGGRIVAPAPTRFPPAGG